MPIKRYGLLVMFFGMLISILLTETSFVEAATWNSTGWRYRQYITVNEEYIAYGKTNWVAPIEIINPMLKNVGSADSIAFVDNASRQLAHNIEYFNNSYNSTDGRVVAWIKHFNWYNTTNWTIEMWANTTDLQNQENVSGVWNDTSTPLTYAFVSHLGGNQTHFRDDVAGSKFNTVCRRATCPSTNSTGLIGQSLYFDTTSAGLGIEGLNGTNLYDNAFWISTWSYLMDASETRAVIAGTDAAQSDYMRLRYSASSGYSMDVNYVTDYRTAIANDGTATNRWVMLSANVNSSGDIINFYINNTHISSTAGANLPLNSIKNTTIGEMMYYSYPTELFVGHIDEVWIGGGKLNDSDVQNKWEIEKNASEYYIINTTFDDVNPPDRFPQLNQNFTNTSTFIESDVAEFGFNLSDDVELSFLFVEHNMTSNGASTNITIPLSGTNFNASANITIVSGTPTDFYVKPYFNDSINQINNTVTRAIYSTTDGISPSFTGNVSNQTSVTVDIANTFEINITDAGSNITSVTAEFENVNQQRENLTLSNSSLNSAGQNVRFNGSYTPDEVGTWYIKFYTTDFAGNANSTPSRFMQFTVNAAPSGGAAGSSGGGGGGGGCSIGFTKAVTGQCIKVEKIPANVTKLVLTPERVNFPFFFITAFFTESSEWRQLFDSNWELRSAAFIPNTSGFRAEIIDNVSVLVTRPIPVTRNFGRSYSSSLVVVDKFGRVKFSDITVNVVNPAFYIPIRFKSGDLPAFLGLFVRETEGNVVGIRYLPFILGIFWFIYLKRKVLLKAFTRLYLNLSRTLKEGAKTVKSKVKK